ncbi:MAG: N-6 DNA methylase [Verrucomicrobiota bacterium]
MAMTFEEAWATVKALAQDFEANKAHYLSPTYQESEVRTDFINKILIALGWDVNHDWQKNPFQQEVKVERGVNMGTSQRRADYAFYIAPNFRRDDVRLFVEAKKPFGDIATPDNCFQIIRYAWIAGTPVAVLTDFEQFQILDCRYKPRIDTATSQVLRKYHYADYSNAEKFGEIFHLFSRDAVAAGSLDKFAADLPKKRGKGSLLKGDTQSFDDAFLEELDEYRDILARAFKNKNPELEGETLTEITQRTLDRLVFIRFLEDKQILPDYLVAHFGKKGTAWQDFVAASRKLDGIYNGIVFKAHSILDSASFKVDDDAFADICKRLSHQYTSYPFDCVPIEILGSIYERFLGKVITTTDKRAKVEEKPEVRKAGGVYYTPEYIVRYIVDNTVGKLIEGKTPSQIAELRFADIACGSGSFLLGVFDKLLIYHRDWYNANPDKAKKAGCVQREDGAWHLSLKQRREILVNNVYGVDIDHQAVEVAQLSLYLKLLEEETIGTAREYQLEFHETLLPSLNKNILCGNSLIGTDVLTGQLFEAVEEKKLNPMDFEDRFPQIFQRRPANYELHETAAVPLDYTAPGVPLHGSYSRKKKPGNKEVAATTILPPEWEGGFDAIVGNPPYGAETGKTAIGYFREHYQTLANSLDTFIAFVERAASVIKPNGYLGYIIPSGWVSTPSCRKLRHLFVRDFFPESFVSLPYDVFDGAYIDAMIVTARKSRNDKAWTDSSSDSLVRLFVFPVRFKIKGAEDFYKFKKIGDLSGWLVNEDSEFLVTASREETQLVTKLRKQKNKFEDVVMVMRGIEEFHPRPASGMARAVRAFNGEMRRYILDLGEIAYEDYTPSIEAGKPERFFAGTRLLLRQLLSRKFRLQAVYADEIFLTNQSVQSLILKPGCSISLKAILAILNSRIISWYFCQINTVARRDDFPKLIIKQTRELPFPANIESSVQTRLNCLVEQMLTTQKQLAVAMSDKDKDFYGNKCVGLDRQIDALVYELYGLTHEEIKIVEMSVK